MSTSRFYTVILCGIACTFLAGYEADASQLIYDSKEFTTVAWDSLVGDTFELTGSSHADEENFTTDFAEIEEESEGSEENEEIEENIVSENEKQNTKDNDPGDEKDQDSGKEKDNDNDSVSKSDLKIKNTASDNFGCERIYGFSQKDDIMLLSKSPDESDEESIIGYVKCLGDTFKPGVVVKIKSYKSYMEDEYSETEEDVKNVISLTGYKEISEEDLSKELTAVRGEELSEDDDFIFYDSDRRVIDQDELDDLSKEQCDIARNEIYARHGRMFKSDQLQEYFNSKSWYEPRYESDSFPESLLNKTEKKNAYMILEYEKKKGYM